MNIAKIFRTSILKNIFEQLLLKVTHCFNFLMNKVHIRSGTLYRSCSVSYKCVRRLRTLCNRRLYQINKCRPSQIACTVTTVYATCTQTALHVHKSSCTILIPLYEINLNLSMCYFFLPCAWLAPPVHDDFMLATSLPLHQKMKFSI